LELSGARRHQEYYELVPVPAVSLETVKGRERFATCAV
jgi:hypothetical protein